ncbi:hypothetical protein AgCh_014883 [Apium graveolens]
MICCHFFLILLRILCKISPITTDSTVVSTPNSVISTISTNIVHSLTSDCISTDVLNNNYPLTLSTTTSTDVSHPLTITAQIEISTVVTSADDLVVVQSLLGLRKGSEHSERLSCSQAKGEEKSENMQDSVSFKAEAFTHHVPAYQVLAEQDNVASERILNFVHTTASMQRANDAITTMPFTAGDEFDYPAQLVVRRSLGMKMMMNKISYTQGEKQAIAQVQTLHLGCLAKTVMSTISNQLSFTSFNKLRQLFKPLQIPTPRDFYIYFIFFYFHSTVVSTPNSVISTISTNIVHPLTSDCISTDVLNNNYPLTLSTTTSTDVSHPLTITAQIEISTVVTSADDLVVVQSLLGLRKGSEHSERLSCSQAKGEEKSENMQDSVSFKAEAFTHHVPAYQVLAEQDNVASERILNFVHTTASMQRANDAITTMPFTAGDEFDYPAQLVVRRSLGMKMMMNKISCTQGEKQAIAQVQTLHLGCLAKTVMSTISNQLSFTSFNKLRQLFKPLQIPTPRDFYIYFIFFYFLTTDSTVVSTPNSVISTISTNIVHPLTSDCISTDVLNNNYPLTLSTTTSTDVSHPLTITAQIEISTVVTSADDLVVVQSLLGLRKGSEHSERLSCSQAKGEEKSENMQDSVSFKAEAFTHHVPAYQVLAEQDNVASERILNFVHTTASMQRANDAITTMPFTAGDEFDYPAQLVVRRSLGMKMMMNKISCTQGEKQAIAQVQTLHLGCLAKTVMSTISNQLSFTSFNKLRQLFKPLQIPTPRDFYIYFIFFYFHSTVVSTPNSVISTISTNIVHSLTSDCISTDVLNSNYPLTLSTTTSTDVSHPLTITAQIEISTVVTSADDLVVVQSLLGLRKGSEYSERLSCSQAKGEEKSENMQGISSSWQKANDAITTMPFTAGDEFDYPAGGSEEFGDEDDEEDFMHTGGEAGHSSTAAILFSSYLGFLSETMLNLPDSLYPDPIQGDNSVMSNGGAPANNNGPCDGASKAIDWPSASVEDLVVLLREPEHREKAISSLTQIKEVLSIYKSLTPEKLTMKDSSKVCDVLVLFECLATHPQTKMQFLNVQIHCYLYPFLETEETSKPFQYLRLMSLGVIGGLLKEARPITLKNLQDLFQKLSMGSGPNAEAVGDVAGSSHLDR